MPLSRRQLFIRSVLIACLLLATHSFAGAQKPAQPKRSKDAVTVWRVYDPATDETVTSVSYGLGDYGLGLGRNILFRDGAPGRYSVGSLMRASYKFSGKAFKRPDSVSVMFLAQGGNKYQTQNDYTVKADGEQVLQGKADYAQRQIDMGQKINKDLSLEEELTLVVPLDIFTQLAKAKKIQIKIGPTGFSLNDKQREMLQALVASLDKCEQPDCLWGTLNR